jgi:hypothetical protein
MFVILAGEKSDERAIYGPIQDIAAELLATLRPIVSHKKWLTHRLTMAAIRRLAAHVGDDYPHFGPRPDLISKVPWGHAKWGDWLLLPHGVAARVVRASRAKMH